MRINSFTPCLIALLLLAPAEISVATETAPDKGTTPTLATLNPDFDGDGSVDSDDLLDFLGHSGPAKGEAKYEIRYDLNYDDRIDDLDLVIFIDSWKKNVAPRTPISPELLRAKLGIFEFEPKDPDDPAPFLEPEVYNFDSNTVDAGGDPLQDSLPAYMVVQAATETDGRAVNAILLGKEEGLGPYVAVLSATGPITLNRFELVGSVPVDVPTGSVVLNEQGFLLSQPMNLTPPDQVISGDPTVSTGQVEVEVTVDPSKAGYTGWPFVKGASMTMSIVVPITAETTLFDLSNQGDWSQILSCLRFSAAVPIQGFMKGLPLGTGIQTGSVDVLWGARGGPTGGPEYLRAASTIGGSFFTRQYQKPAFTRSGCYKGLEPNDTELTAPSIPMAGAVCIRKVSLVDYVGFPPPDASDWYSFVPAFEGEVEVTLIQRAASRSPVRLILKQGGIETTHFDLNPPAKMTDLNARSFRVPVQPNDPFLINLSLLSDAPPDQYVYYILSLRYTRFEVNCVSEVEPNDSDVQAQVLTGTGCITGQVVGGTDNFDTFRIETDAEKTAQILLSYKVTGAAGIARLVDSVGGIVKQQNLETTSQATFFSQFAASEPLSFFVFAPDGSHIEYSLAYAVTDSGGGGGGACRDETPNNLSRAQAVGINPPDCINGLIHPTDKVESWFTYQPSEDGVFHALSEVAPVDGSFLGFSEFYGSDPVAPPINFTVFDSAGFFPLSARLNGGQPYFVRFASGGDGSALTSTRYRFAPDGCQEELLPDGNNTGQLAESFGSAPCVSGFVAASGDARDFFRYTEPAGGWLRFLIAGSSSSLFTNTAVSLYNGANLGAVVDSTFANPNSATFLYATATPNSEWVIGLDCSQEDLDYTIRALPPMICSIDLEPNDSPIAAHFVSSSSCTQGEVGVTPGDSVDFFRVHCPNAGTLRIVVVSNDHSNNGFADVEIQDSFLRLIQLSNFAADYGGASFDYGVVAGEEILVRIANPSDPFRYELRVEIP